MPRHIKSAARVEASMNGNLAFHLCLSDSHALQAHSLDCKQSIWGNQKDRSGQTGNLWVCQPTSTHLYGSVYVVSFTKWHTQTCTDMHAWPQAQGGEPKEKGESAFLCGGGDDWCLEEGRARQWSVDEKQMKKSPVPNKWFADLGLPVFWNSDWNEAQVLNCPKQ